MTQNRQADVGILLCDVCDSTTLYERLGDTRAKGLIGRCIDLMKRAVADHGGTVVKEIGDEVESRFPDALSAVRTASQVQMSVDSEDWGDQTIQVTAGVHYGPVIISERDMYGDAVHIASRMIGIAKARQIVVSDAVIDRLAGADDIEYRKFPIAGDESIFQILWEPKRSTIMHTPITDGPATQAVVLQVTYGDQKQTLEANGPALTIGRDPGSGLIVAGDRTSRRHVSISYRAGKFVATDESTNGSFVKMQGAPEAFIRLESLALLGEGVISLGTPISENQSHLIYFRCE